MNLDARPPTTNLALYGGDDTTIQLTVVDNAGVPIDLSAGELAAQVRRHAETEVICELRVDDTSAAAGIVYVVFTGADTETLAADGGAHAWDLEHRTLSAVHTITAGSIRTDSDITRLGVP